MTKFYVTWGANGSKQYRLVEAVSARHAISQVAGDALNFEEAADVAVFPWPPLLVATLKRELVVKERSAS